MNQNHVLNSLDNQFIPLLKKVFADIKSVSQDSRTTKPHDLFIVVPGKNDAIFFEEALNKGVSSFIMEDSTHNKIRNHSNINCSARSLLIVNNARLCFAMICKFLFQKQPQTCVAVTGTNGKSSVVNFTKQFFEHGGKLSASLGTLGLESSRDCVKISNLPPLTTLDALSFYRTLKHVKEHNIDFLAMEASSHGISQYRMHGVGLEAAAFTGLTQDHLDYHETMESYFQSKLKLFSEILTPGKTAIIYKDNQYSQRVIDVCKQKKHKIICYSATKKTDIYSSNIVFLNHGIQFHLNVGNNVYQNLFLQLIGLFQLENVLCSIALSLSCGIGLDTIIKSISHIKGTKGRMEYVGKFNNASIFVDYAHTPDALKNILLTSRFHTKKKVGVVFGCGGDRDASKRAIMGKIAEKYADFVIITDDNPRTENAAVIRESILKNCPKGLNMGNREEAIAKGLELLKPEDILIVAGKGHEHGQIIGSKVYPFNDAVCVKNHIKEKNDA